MRHRTAMWRRQLNRNISGNCSISGTFQGIEHPWRSAYLFLLILLGILLDSVIFPVFACLSHYFQVQAVTSVFFIRALGRFYPFEWRILFELWQVIMFPLILASSLLQNLLGRQIPGLETVVFLRRRAPDDPGVGSLLFSAFFSGHCFLVVQNLHSGGLLELGLGSCSRALLGKSGCVLLLVFSGCFLVSVSGGFLLLLDSLVYLDWDWGSFL